MLRRLFGGAPQTPKYLMLPGGHDVEIVGESHYQENIAKVAGSKGEHGAANSTVVAALIREPTNQYDRNAVMVMVQGDLPQAVLAGYLSRSLAKAIGPTFKRIAELGFAGAACQADITGGWKRQGSEGSFGVVLNLASKGQVQRYLVAFGQNPSATPLDVFADNEESERYEHEEGWDVPGWVENED